MEENNEEKISNYRTFWEWDVVYYENKGGDMMDKKKKRSRRKDVQDIRMEDGGKMPWT